MIKKFKIFEGTIHVQIDPYEEEVWDEENYILISGLKEFDELKCKANVGVLKTQYRYYVTKVKNNSIIVMSEIGDTFVLDEKTLNEYFDLVTNENAIW